jgi:hypothetical protein
VRCEKRRLYLIAVESEDMVEIILFYIYLICVLFLIIMLRQDFSPLILLCCFLYGDCTLSIDTQVDKVKLWDVLEGGEEEMPSV